MIVPTGQVVRISKYNPQRCYFLVQNTDTTATNYIYLLQYDGEPYDFTNQGIKVGGLGFFEMQNCVSEVSKRNWYVYTDASDIDIRVADI